MSNNQDKLPGVHRLTTSDFKSLENGLLKVNKDHTVLCMVYGNYCGHCKSAAPAFSSVNKANNTNTNRTVTLCAIQTDSDSQDTKQILQYLPTFLAKHNVEFQGVPTYLIFRNGQWSEFTGGRSEEDLWNFIRKN